MKKKRNKSFSKMIDDINAQEMVESCNSPSIANDQYVRMDNERKKSFHYIACHLKSVFFCKLSQ